MMNYYEMLKAGRIIEIEDSNNKYDSTRFWIEGGQLMSRTPLTEAVIHPNNNAEWLEGHLEAMLAEGMILEIYAENGIQGWQIVQIGADTYVVQYLERMGVNWKALGPVEGYDQEGLEDYLGVKPATKFPERIQKALDLELITWEEAKMLADAIAKEEEKAREWGFEAPTAN